MLGEDLSSLRAAYCVGNFERAVGIAQDIVSGDADGRSGELMALYWKSVSRRSGMAGISKTAASLPFSTIPDLLKRVLVQWSKATTDGAAALSTGDVTVVRDLAVRAHEAADLSPEHREQVILTAAETLLAGGQAREAFALLKLAKATSLDCQVVFVDILLELGLIDMARKQLVKMQAVSEWTDDARFLLCEISVALHGGSSAESSDEDAPFGTKEALYTLQELMQVHGSTARLLTFVAGCHALLGKFSEAQAALLQAARLEPANANVQANLLAVSMHLSVDGADSAISYALHVHH